MNKSDLDAASDTLSNLAWSHGEYDMSEAEMLSVMQFITDPEAAKDDIAYFWYILARKAAPKNLEIIAEHCCNNFLKAVYFDEGFKVRNDS